jgi:hypothetical protein
MNAYQHTPNLIIFFKNGELVETLNACRFHKNKYVVQTVDIPMIPSEIYLDEMDQIRVMTKKGEDRPLPFKRENAEVLDKLFCQQKQDYK